MILDGKASDILWDYTEGKYTLHIDELGELQFVDEKGTLWDIPEQVQFYLNQVETHCH